MCVCGARLFVRTQTYDIPCDPRHPAKWLLQQAKNILKANPNHAANSRSDQSHSHDDLEVLYNRTTRKGESRRPVGVWISWSLIAWRACL